MKRNTRPMLPLALLLFVGGTRPAAAIIPCQDALIKEAEQAFYDPTLYRQARCVHNVDEVTKRLLRSGVPVESIRILYLLYESYENAVIPIPLQDDLTPAQPRQRRLPYLWRMHTVVQVDDQIIDVDYSPRPQSIEEYFHAMFPRSPHHPDGGLERYLGMRVVPASVHRAAMDQHGGNDAAVARRFGDRIDSLPEFPVCTVAEYLARK